MLSERDFKLIEKEIENHLCDETETNPYPIFNREQGYQIYNGTDLKMVMDKVKAGIKSAKKKIEEEWREEDEQADY